MIGELTDASRDFRTGRLKVTFTLEAADAEFINDLSNKRLTIDVKPYREKRSKDANAYLWVLIGKIAAKVRTTPEAIYRECIADIGGNYDVVCVLDKAVEKLCQAWHSNGVGWITKTTTSKVNGCTNVFLYYGSSTYNTEQFSRLLDVVIEAAKAQGIETATPDELELLKENYKGEKQ